MWVFLRTKVYHNKAGDKSKQGEGKSKIDWTEIEETLSPCTLTPGSITLWPAYSSMQYSAVLSEYPEDLNM